MANSEVPQTAGSAEPDGTTRTELHPAKADAAVTIPFLQEEARSSETTVAGPLPAVAPPAAIFPEQLGRYRLLGVIGEGGMGTVYLAHDTELDRRVALKVPRFPEGREAEGRERFCREARIAATFRHKHLCPVYDVGVINGTNYLTMPLLTGEPLSACLQREGRLPEAEAVRLTMQVARALQVAHAAGVVHRDLKPANIMVQEGLEPIVMDFGLARRVGPRDSRLTEQGALVGTPAYLAPEQIGGDPDLLGPGCDLYSLGVILYETLTGRLPFQGTVHEVLTQVLTQAPGPPSRHCPDLDPRLDAICLRALAKKPHARFASAAAFADALEALSRQPKPTRRPGSRGGAWLVLACIGILGLAILVWLAFVRSRGSEQGNPLEDAVQPGSHWHGTFRFGPDDDKVRGVNVTIRERTGNRFVGEYASEEGDYRWIIEGTIENETIAWKFTRVIQEAQSMGVVESAFVKGKINSRTMTIAYTDADSSVQIVLRRTD